MDALWMALRPVAVSRDDQVFGPEALVRGPAGALWPQPADVIRKAQEMVVSAAAGFA